MIPLALAHARRISWGSDVNIVADGNSLFAMHTNGISASASNKRVPEATLATFPLASSGATLANVSISGQSWATMAANRADVAAAYQAGKNNILLLWEDTNSVYTGSRTPSQTVGDKAAYIAAERSARNWRAVVCLTTIPREPASDQSQRDTMNGYLEQVDELTWQTFREIGITRLVDTRRPGSPFRFANYLPASFDAAQTYYGETTQNQRIHLRDAGCALVAQWVAEELARLPA